MLVSGYKEDTKAGLKVRLVKNEIFFVSFLLRTMDSTQLLETYLRSLWQDEDRYNEMMCKLASFFYGDKRSLLITGEVSKTTFRFLLKKIFERRTLTLDSQGRILSPEFFRATLIGPKDLFFFTRDINPVKVVHSPEYLHNMYYDLINGGVYDYFSPRDVYPTILKSDQILNYSLDDRWRQLDKDYMYKFFMEMSVEHGSVPDDCTSEFLEHIHIDRKWDEPKDPNLYRIPPNISKDEFMQFLSPYICRVKSAVA